MGQGELGATEQRPDHSHQRCHSRLTTDDGVALKRFFQQAHRVHGVLSDLNNEFATTIRSDDSMHVDPLIDCIFAIFYRNSWRYFRSYPEYAYVISLS